uniref:DNA-directed RNA polymerase N-terminal domain-containing protein n=1 Tax=Populus trichocarpa TaxID=3694 RepID=A0A2K1X627_POPTR
MHNGLFSNRKGAKKYGVIQCDPLVLKGLEKTARHMVIPYMPMLVPPLRCRGYVNLFYIYSFATIVLF